MRKNSFYNNLFFILSVRIRHNLSAIDTFTIAKRVRSEVTFVSLSITGFFILKMDVKDIMKFQMLTGLGGGSARQTSPLNSTSDATQSAPLASLIPMFTQCLMVALVGVIDEAVKQLPTAVSSAKSYLYNRYVKEKVTHTLTAIQKPIADGAVPCGKRHFLNTITMTRWYKSEDKGVQELSASVRQSNELVDAVLDVIAHLENVPSLQLIESGKMMVTYKAKPLQLTKNIFVKLDKLDMDADGSLSCIRLVLSSNHCTACEINQYVKSILDDHKRAQKNALGNTVFFFDQKNRYSMGDPRGTLGGPNEDAIANKRLQVSRAPKELSFTRTHFHSTKTFENTFGDQVREVESRVRFFMENEDWYCERGIPYQLGIMLSGPPGTGKTSCIRAIANRTRRHIINVNFSSIETATQLKHLLFSESLTSFVDSTAVDTQKLNIPINQRLYVLEEVDAIGDIVRQRSPEEPGRETVPDELTLAEILTALDGTVESPGRILIMTSNHPEFLDEALIRPGRIDVCLTLSYASRALQAELYQAFYKQAFPAAIVDYLPDMILTPAEIGQTMFKHFQNPCPRKILEDLCRQASSLAARRSPSPPSAYCLPRSCRPKEIVQAQRDVQVLHRENEDARNDTDTSTTEAHLHNIVQKNEEDQKHEHDNAESSTAAQANLLQSIPTDINEAQRLKRLELQRPPDLSVRCDTTVPEPLSALTQQFLPFDSVTDQSLAAHRPLQIAQYAEVIS